jgi:hypothetical protein
MGLVVMAVALFPLALDARGAGAFPAGDDVFNFRFRVDAVTHIQKFDQTIAVSGGTFTGGIDFVDGSIEGDLVLPTTQFTFKLAGVVPLVTATAQIVSKAPITGYADLYQLPDVPLTTTAVFSIRILEAHAEGTQLNLVGNWCKTASPITLTMSATARLGAPTTMSGTFTMPPFQNCGAATEALTLAISGPNNTFTATATPY